MNTADHQDNNLAPSTAQHLALDWLHTALEEVIDQTRILLSQKPVDWEQAASGLHQLSGSLYMAQQDALAHWTASLEKGVLSHATANDPDTLATQLDGQLAALKTELSLRKKHKRDRPLWVQQLHRQWLAERNLRDDEAVRVTPDLRLLALRADGKQLQADVDTQGFLKRGFRHAIARSLPTALVADQFRISQLAAYLSRSQTSLEAIAIWQIGEVLLAHFALLSVAARQRILMDLERTSRPGAPEDDILSRMIDQLIPLTSDGAVRLKHLMGLDWQQEGTAEAGTLEHVYNQLLALKQYGASLDDAALVLRDTSDQLAATGWHDMARHLRQLLNKFGHDQRLPDEWAVDIEAILRQLARLLGVGSADTPVDPISAARMAAIHEARSQLESIKEQYLGWQTQGYQQGPLTGLDTQLGQIQGVLAVLGLPGTDLLQPAIDRLATGLVQADQPASWRQRELIAEWLSALEFHLDQLAAGYHDDQILKNGLQLLQEYDQAATAPEPVQVGGDKVYHDEQRMDDAEALTAAETGGTGSTVDEAMFDSVMTDRLTPDQSAVSEPTGTEKAATEKAATGKAVTESATIDQPPASGQDDTAAGQTARDTEILTAPVSAMAMPAPLEVPADEFDKADEDIREIFGEEVEEVLDAVHAAFPLWASDFSDEASLKEFRRGFHTLKGSGRMVGARAMGELAWTIENMLNRVIDNTIEPDQHMVDLIGAVLSVTPELVADFQQQRPPSLNPGYLMALGSELVARRPITSAQIQRASDPNAIHDLEGDAPPAEAEDPLPAVAAGSMVATPASESPLSDIADTNAVPLVLQDESLRDVFLQEAGAHLQVLRQWLADAAEPHAIDENLLRALHTLRGSAGMAEAISIYQLTRDMEDMCRKRVRHHQLLGEVHLTLLQQLADQVGTHLDAINRQQLLPLSSADQQLLEQIQLHSEDMDQAGNDSALEDRGLQVVVELLALNIDNLLEAEWTLQDQNALLLRQDWQLWHQEAMTLQQAPALSSLPMMVALTDWLVRTYGHLAQTALVMPVAVRQQLALVHQGLTGIFDALAASTIPQLDASVSQAQQAVDNWLASAVTVLEASYTPTVAKALTAEVAPDADSQETGTQKTGDQKADTQPMRLSGDAVEAEPAMATGTDPRPAPEAALLIPPAAAGQTAAQADSRQLDIDFDPEMMEIFLEEAAELTDQIDVSFGRWKSNPDSRPDLAALQRQLHTLKGGARMAGVASIGDLSHEIESLYDLLVAGRQQPDPFLIQFIQHGQDVLAEQVTMLKQQGRSFFAPEELTVLQSFLQRRDPEILQQFLTSRVSDSQPSQTVQPSDIQPDAAADIVAVDADADADAETGQDDTAEQNTDSEMALPEVAVPAEALQVVMQPWREGHAPDPDLFALFHDEAQHLIDRSTKQLKAWISDDDTLHLPELQRALHTLKGSARTAGVQAISDVAHELEYLYEAIMLAGNTQVPQAIKQLTLHAHQWLDDAIAQVNLTVQPVESAALLFALQESRKGAWLRGDRLKQARLYAQQPGSAVAPLQKMTLPPMEGLFNQRNDRDQASGEMIRVSSGLMEKLINLSGENAINRARIEIGLTSMTQTMEDMGATIQRLADQLRRMEGELETQILAREGSERHADFDPLEMDQYSSLNQLSKSLAESSSDLLDLKNTLLERSREAESLLLQQSRIQSEISEGLMNSRLVPFSRLVPRLSRVVRQTATELGKQADLQVINAEGEIDRTILERVTAPLEHMLRNAVDHGLERPEWRHGVGKPASGNITLAVEREGNEMVITLTDDGKGIDVVAVRRKAIERGLIAADSELSDREVIQFIFNAGLSTAQEITQVSGRGVGMDVVQSEIKQLGGVISVDTTSGQGTRFILRLPLTVAVTDALMVRAGDRSFAISLTQVDRIVRVSPEQLDRYYQERETRPDQQMLLDGVMHRVSYLGEMLGQSRRPNLAGQTAPIPLLVVKEAGTHTAVQVDQLIGSREEIVIKPVGQQLGNVRGLAGATIMGDGSVMLILDLIALSRSLALVRQLLQQQEVAASPQQRRLVMVVDDSVTVRKVTSRFLERYGFDVVTAKDGMDAMARLEEVTPDIMLLDVEMPRMDGFEVATQVRHSPVHRGLPIIMITSRTGIKHRERAFATGVNAYMGKPYQEQELLDNINELLAMQTIGQRQIVQ